MKLSAPIYVLKKKAKELRKSSDLTLSEALNQIAKNEGYNSWSLLQSQSDRILPESYEDILEYLNPGDLVLLGSRPTFGKTTFSTGLLVQAINKKKGKNFYFSLSEVHKDIAGRIANYDQSIGHNNPHLGLDYSDLISSEYIIKKLKDENIEGSLIIIDYLQLLDQQRSKPQLQNQIESLKEFARERKCIFIFISQVNREIQYRDDQRPELNDIFFPNPVDINLFNKIFFLYREGVKIEVLFRKPTDHRMNLLWDDKRHIVCNL